MGGRDPQNARKRPRQREDVHDGTGRGRHGRGPPGPRAQGRVGARAAVGDADGLGVLFRQETAQARQSRLGEGLRAGALDVPGSTGQWPVSAEHVRAPRRPGGRERSPPPPSRFGAEIQGPWVTLHSCQVAELKLRPGFKCSFKKEKKKKWGEGERTQIHISTSASLLQRRGQWRGGRNAGGLPDTRDGDCHPPPSPRAGGEPPDPRGPARCFRKLKCVHVSRPPGTGGAAPAREECVCCLL